MFKKTQNPILRLLTFAQRKYEVHLHVFKINNSPKVMISFIQNFLNCWHKEKTQIRKHYLSSNFLLRSFIMSTQIKVRIQKLF